MTTFLFPGQGSQVLGMGGNLFAEFPDIVTQADHILGYSISKLCLEDPDKQLNNTLYTQPALFTVNALSFLKQSKELKLTPNYCAGHSLGEYDALFAAEVFDFATGLKLVQKRAELMSRAQGGKMAAVVGLGSETIQKLLNENQLTGITIANFNTYTQIVISGPSQAITDAEPLFKQAGASLYLPLRVSGAFHSNYMKSAQDEFTDFIKSFTFNKPKIPVISNVTCKPYQPNEIADLLSQQITHSVLWTQSIEYLLAQGETNFIEIGPGNVLKGLITRIRKGQ